MYKFSRCEAYHRLLQLAEKPVDLTSQGVLNPERIEQMVVSACGLKFLYGMERIDTDVMAALGKLAVESHAIEKMKDMQSGEVINRIDGYPSEERAVLHTAMRAFVRDGYTGDAAEKARREFDKLRDFMGQVDKFTDLVMVGIGGSDLGPRALYLALEPYSIEGRKVHFISNVDPDDAERVLRDLDLKKTMVVVVSKSGTTLETLTNEVLVKNCFVNAGLDPKEHFVAVTGEGSPMDDAAKYLASFYIWDYVGGRYSATSMVGGVMLSFALGIDGYADILRGACDMDHVALNPNIMENMPLVSALISVWNRNFLKYPTEAVLPYSQALVRMPAHLQQCSMESNGKHITKDGARVDFDTGAILWGEPGTNGQHSFYQLIHQGTDIVPTEFIGFKENQGGLDLEVKGTTSQEKLLANLFAQALALALGQDNDNPNKRFEGNRPSTMILAKKLDPYTLGALLAYYEHKIAFQGFIWDINSFDQEGVQLGKVLANKIIDIFAQQRKGEATTAFPLAEALLEHIAPL